MVTKYNYHVNEWGKRNVLYNITNPLNLLRNKRDMRVLCEMTANFQDVKLKVTESRFNMAKFVHDELEKALTCQSPGIKKRTFFDSEDLSNEKAQEKYQHFTEQYWTKNNPLEEADAWESIAQNPDLRLSSLDLTVYAFLKEEIVNTSNSDEVTYLNESCPKLMKFYKLMEAMFNPKFTIKPKEDEDDDIEANLEAQEKQDDLEVSRELFKTNNSIQFVARERQITVSYN